jgi:hypothetical protein
MSKLYAEAHFLDQAAEHLTAYVYSLDNIENKGG